MVALFSRTQAYHCLQFRRFSERERHSAYSNIFQSIRFCSLALNIPSSYNQNGNEYAMLNGVSVPKLNGRSNYNDWVKWLEIALRLHNAEHWYILTGVMRKPTKPIFFEPTIEEARLAVARDRTIYAGDVNNKQIKFWLQRFNRVTAENCKATGSLRRRNGIRRNLRLEATCFILSVMAFGLNASIAALV